MILLFVVHFCLCVLFFNFTFRLVCLVQLVISEKREEEMRCALAWTDCSVYTAAAAPPSQCPHACVFVFKIQPSLSIVLVALPIHLSYQHYH